MRLNKCGPLHGTVTVPGDKSISHRSVMLGSLAKGTTRVTNFLNGADCLATIDCFSKMGIEIESSFDSVIIHGKGLYGLKKPVSSLYTGNSGTTMRLLSGILAGQNFSSDLYGDDSLNKRPMKRIIDPLSSMNANIKSRLNNGCAPLDLLPSSLHGIHYHPLVASAQVKSSILFAGMYADSVTSVTEPVLSRNHTELMLKDFGASISTDGSTVSILPDPVLEARNIKIPGDISSAAYLIAAALLMPGCELLIQNVGINPTRSGFLTVCENMGADISYINQDLSGQEPVADLLVRSSSLHAVTIEGEQIPSLIDELPILAVMAAFAEGTTFIRDAKELKVKESDRILSITKNLTHMGGDVIPTDDGMIIYGKKPLHGTRIESFYDHRIAMSFAVAALASEGESTLDHPECIDVSYPGFFETIQSLL